MKDAAIVPLLVFALTMGGMFLAVIAAELIDGKRNPQMAHEKGYRGKRGDTKRQSAESMVDPLTRTEKKT